MRSNQLRRVAVLAGLSGFLCPASMFAASEPPLPSARALAPAVSVVAAATREVRRELIVSGTLVPRDEVMVTPEIEGQRVTAVLVEEGAMVRRGQVLARLSHDLIDLQLAQQEALLAKATATVPQAQTSIDQAEAAALEANQALERARTLMASGNTTATAIEARTSAARQAAGRVAYARDGLDIAKAELAQARATRDELRLRLARTDVRAPDDGVVSRRTARVGMLASASAQPLFRIIRHNEIELEGEVVGDELPLVREGDPASIALGDDRIAGSVRVVYPEVDSSTRLGKLRIRLAPDPRLHIGAFADGIVQIGRVTGVSIPQAAVQHEKGHRTSVLVAEGDTLHRREVRLGLADDEAVQVVTGLAVGERVVSRAGSFLRDGDRIRPVDEATDTIETVTAAPGTNSLRRTAKVSAR